MFLNLFNAHWWLVDAQYTGTFTGGRTYPSCKFREVVGRAEYFVCLMPAFPVHGIVKLWYDISQGASAMAEGDAAVHASRCLFVEFLWLERFYKFIVVLNPL